MHSRSFSSPLCFLFFFLFFIHRVDVCRRLKRNCKKKKCVLLSTRHETEHQCDHTRVASGGRCFSGVGVMKANCTSLPNLLFFSCVSATPPSFLSSRFSHLKHRDKVFLASFDNLPTLFLLLVHINGECQRPVEVVFLLKVDVKKACLHAVSINELLHLPASFSLSFFTLDYYIPVCVFFFPFFFF